MEVDEHFFPCYSTCGIKFRIDPSQNYDPSPKNNSKNKYHKLLWAMARYEMQGFV